MISSIGIDIRHSELKHTSLSWDTLLSLIPNAPILKKTAILLSSILQQVDEVHSVRRRIKNLNTLWLK